MNLQSIIKIKNLYFTQPVLADKINKSFVTNVYKEHKLYGIIVTHTKNGLEFQLLRDIIYNDDAEINKEIEIIKAYISKIIDINSDYNANLGLVANIKYDVKKFDESGNEIIEHKEATTIM